MNLHDPDEESLMIGAGASLDFDRLAHEFDPQSPRSSDQVDAFDTCSWAWSWDALDAVAAPKPPPQAHVVTPATIVTASAVEDEDACDPSIAVSLTSSLPVQPLFGDVDGQPLECPLCRQVMGGIRNPGIIATYSFKCSVRAVAQGCREETSSFQIALAPDPRAIREARYSAPAARCEVRFKVYAAATIRRGRRNLRRDCFLWMVDETRLLHLYCLTPLQGEGSLRWVNEARNEFLALEAGNKYTLDVIATVPGQICAIIPQYTPSLLTEIRPGSAGNAPVEFSHLSSRSMPINVDLEQVEGAPYSLYDVHGHSAPSFDACKVFEQKMYRIENGEPDPKRQRQKDFMDAMSMSDCPDSYLRPVQANTGDSEPCLLCDSRSIASNGTSAYGTLISVHTFTCQVFVGPKNLRQKANAFDFSLGGVTKHIRFKVYADSTIRRGKKSLRRNCFTFQFGAQHTVHILCQQPLRGRSSLKWTDEKKERFLAFEGGIPYVIQVYSLVDNEFCDVRLAFPNILLGLSPGVQPLASPVHSRGDAIDSPFDSPNEERSIWSVQPNSWNVSQNPGSSYMVMFESSLPLASEPPTVLVETQDCRQLVLIPKQFDRRSRRSFFVSIPRLFSSSVAENALQSGQYFSHVSTLKVLNDVGAIQWTTPFVVEGGIEPYGDGPVRIIIQCLPSRAHTVLRINVEETSPANLLRMIRTRLQLQAPDHCLVYNGVVINEDAIALSQTMVASIQDGDVLQVQDRCGDFRLVERIETGLSASLFIALDSSSRRLILQRFQTTMNDVSRTHLVQMVQRVCRACGANACLQLEQIICDPSHLTSQISSPRVIALAFEHCDLGTLDSLVQRRCASQLQLYSYAQVLDMAYQMSSALRALHESSIVHGWIELRDFFASTMHDDASRMRLKLAGYDRCRSSDKIEEQAANIDSLGRLIYQLATLDTSVHACSNMGRRLEGSRHFLRDLHALVAAMCDHDHLQRPSAAEVHQHISSLLHTSAW